jgi:hypothetical protein
MSCFEQYNKSLPHWNDITPPTWPSCFFAIDERQVIYLGLNGRTFSASECTLTKQSTKYTVSLKTCFLPPLALLQYVET